MTDQSDIPLTDLKPGHLVQLDDWFGDAWAEALDVWAPSNDDGVACAGWVLICRYSKYGDERWTSLESLSKVRCARPREAVTRGNLHLAEGKVGMYGREWPTPLTTKSRFNSNRPERHPDGPRGRPEPGFSM